VSGRDNRQDRSRQKRFFDALIGAGRRLEYAIEKI
jgi:hypothetical protein